MSRVIKTAIAIPKQDYQKIEMLRVQQGKTRSQLLMEAFHEWLRRQEELDQERRYQEGYRRAPENLTELKGYLRAGAAAWQKESW
jgi:hypothetical protein